MLLGCAGMAFTVTLSVVAALCPQLFSARTLRVPLAVPAKTVILFEVELPDHPEGSVQEYDVAPLTAAIL